MVVSQLKGKRFGKLVVLDRVENNSENRSQWLCRCDCGNEKVIVGSNLTKKSTKSCGCLVSERNKEVHTKHNMSRDRLYNIHYHMVSRTSNINDPAYSNYGGRGVSVCEEWLDEKEGLKNFVDWSYKSGYNDSLTLDRKDNSKGYSPTNCRWTTYRTQNNNKRNNLRFTLNGETKTEAEWSEKLGGSRGLITDRLQRGWTVERALTSPVERRQVNVQRH